MKAILFLMVLSVRIQGQSYPGANTITQDQLKSFLSFISSDSLQGRNTPSRGLDIAADYIASKLATWGVKPAGEQGTYFQNIPLYENRILRNESYCAINGQRFEFGDFIPYQKSGDGTVTADLIYVQHGWCIPKMGIDSYKNLDVRGKIVIAHRDYPPVGISFEDLAGGVEGVDYEYAWLAARRNGAIGIIYVPSFYFLKEWNSFLMQEAVPSLEKDSAVAIMGSLRLLEALFANEKHSAEEILAAAMNGKYIEPFELSKSKKVTVSLKFEPKMVMIRNVIGMVEGRDAKLKKEFVAMGAHYDHIGLVSPVNGDSICNGADDDGSGSSAVLALAQAFSEGTKPKRSTLFVWHCGEEKGLWGSKYFVDHPTVPIESIVTQLNIDMIGRAKLADNTNPADSNLTTSDELYVIGSKMMSTALGEISERTNRSYLHLKFNYKYDNPNDPENPFASSDHYNYALKGIPIIFYFSGIHADYHQPSDSIEKIDFQKMERITRTVYATAWEISNRKERPKVDKPLSNQKGK